MKKNLLVPACLLASSMFSVNAAEATPSTFYLYDSLINLGTDEEPDYAYTCGQFTKVSPNGHYAVGYDDVLTGFSYMWDATSKQLTLLNKNYEFQGKVYDVANDGTMVGCFVTEESKYTPGYYKEGTWTALPLCDDVYEGYLDSETDMSFAPCVKAISGDGKYMAASVSLNDGRYHPLQWVDGELKEFKDIELFGQGFIVTDMSEDGSIICGSAETSQGDRLPAIIKDGELKYLMTFDELLAKFGLAEGDDHQMGNVCEVRDIDAHGNITGYIQSPVDGTVYGFIYNDTDKMKFFEAGTIATCSVNSKYVIGQTNPPYGAPIFFGESSNTDVMTEAGLTGAMASIYEASDNGQIMAGCGIVSLPEFGDANVPALIDFPAADPTASVLGTFATDGDNDTKVVLQKNGVIAVYGDFTTVEAYNMSGASVAKGVKGQVVSLENTPAGVYVVVVDNGTSRKSFKVIK